MPAEAHPERGEELQALVAWPVSVPGPAAAAAGSWSGANLPL